MSNRMLLTGVGGHAGGAPWWLTSGIPSVDAVAAYLPKGAGNLAASYVDLTGHGHSAALGVAPALVALGWSFSGLEFLTLPGISQAMNPATVLVRLTAAGIGSRAYIGPSAVGGLEIRIDALGTQSVLAAGAALLGTSAWAISNGDDHVLGTTLNVGGGSGNMYEDGAAPSAYASGSSVAGVGIYQFGSVFGFEMFIGTISAAAIYNVILTDPQILAVSTAMLAL